jgi:hypothetical protein
MRRRDILLQFLVEALVMAAVGAAIGVASRRVQLEAKPEELGVPLQG